MVMSPSDAPITGGTVLRIPALQSPNFLAGSTGWIIRADGTAEFNGATFRGTVVIEGNQAILFYSATPAAGNLVASFSPVAGSDSFGNAYPAGMRVGTVGDPGVVVGFSGSNGFVYFPGTVPNVHLDASIELNTEGAGTGEHSFLTIASAQDATQLDAVAANFVASSADGTGLPQISHAYIDSGGTPHFFYTASFSGAALTGTLTSIQPGTGTSRTNIAVAESWHAVGTLGAGFTADGSPLSGVRYRLLRIDGGIVEIDGSVATSAATAAGATIFTLPAGYVPAFQHQEINVCSFSGVSGANATLTVTNTGAVQAAVAANAAGQHLRLHTLIPLT